MTSAELAVDLVDWFQENIDGEPAVERAECRGSVVGVWFTDGTSFDVTVERTNVEEQS